MPVVPIAAIPAGNPQFAIPIGRRTMVEWIPKMCSGLRRATSAEMPRLSRRQQVVVDLSLRILRNGMVSSGTKRVDTIEVRLALRCYSPIVPSDGH